MNRLKGRKLHLDSKVEKKLVRIFSYYSCKYNLKTKLRIWLANMYYIGSNLILLDIDLVTDGYKESSTIKVLLHELKHAIDWTHNEHKLLNEVGKMDYQKYDNDKVYCRSRSFEKRARTFAKKEISKWL